MEPILPELRYFQSGFYALFKDFVTMLNPHVADVHTDLASITIRDARIYVFMGENQPLHGLRIHLPNVQENQAEVQMNGVYGRACRFVLRNVLEEGKSLENLYVCREHSSEEMVTHFVAIFPNHWTHIQVRFTKPSSRLHYDMDVWLSATKHKFCDGPGIYQVCTVCLNVSKH